MEKETINNDAEMIPDDTTADTVNDAPQDAQNAPVSGFLNDPDVMSYIEKAVQDGIQKALKGRPPKASTKEPAEQEYKQFEKMTYKERLNLFKSNPETYYKLTKGAN